MTEESKSPDKTTACESIQGKDTVDSEETAAPDANVVPVEDELKTLHDRYLRLAAEFENYKKRAQREQGEHARYANERLLKELLPVLDNLQRALQHTRQSGSTNGLVQGVELTCKQYLDALSRLGVRPIPSVGLPFDPAIHQAVATVEAKGHEPNTIVEEYESGYFFHDRVLRPATVTVAASSPEEYREAPVQSTP